MGKCSTCSRIGPEILPCPWCKGEMLCDDCLDGHECQEYPPDVVWKGIRALEGQKNPGRRCFEALQIAVGALESHFPSRHSTEAFESLTRILQAPGK
jgi:hypothetical protein